MSDTKRVNGPYGLVVEFICHIIDNHEQEQCHEEFLQAELCEFVKSRPPVDSVGVDREKVCDKVIEHLSYATGALCSTMSHGTRDNKIINIMLDAEKGVLSLFRAALTAPADGCEGEQ